MFGGSITGSILPYRAKNNRIAAKMQWANNVSSGLSRLRGCGTKETSASLHLFLLGEPLRPYCCHLWYHLLLEQETECKPGNSFDFCCWRCR